MSPSTTRRDGIANEHTPVGWPAVFHRTQHPAQVTFRRPRSRGPEIVGTLIGEVSRGAYFQHWCVQGEGSVVYMVPNSWLTIESFRAAIAARGGGLVAAAGEVA
jgi:hypothetical protein